MEILLVLGFLLLVVTLVGHGVWLFVAFVIRSLTFSVVTGCPRTNRRFPMLVPLA